LENCWSQFVTCVLFTCLLISWDSGNTEKHLRYKHSNGQHECPPNENEKKDHGTRAIKKHLETSKSSKLGINPKKMIEEV
jgi:hypothetical protein